MSEFEVLPNLAVLAFSVLVLLLLRPRYAAWEYQLVVASLGAHFMAAFVQIWLVYRVYHIGDLHAYHMRGLELSLMLRQDLFNTLPHVIRMFLQLDHSIQLGVEDAAPQTATMEALSGLLHLMLGNSLYAVSLLLATASWLGKIAIYEAFRRVLDPLFRPRLLVASLLVPSVVFWSGGMVKEGVAIIGVGLAVLACTELVRTFSLRAMAVFATGALLIGLVKPHILFAMTVAIAAWMYWQRAARDGRRIRVRPVALVLGFVASVAVLYGLGRVFPQLSLDSIGEASARMQSYADFVQSGSVYSLGDPADRTLLAQVSNAPLALLTALYRPLPFDVRNPQMLVNAIESSSMLFVALYAVWIRGVHGIWTFVNRQPILIFSVVFTVLLGIGVGLVSNNLGTLSRYRMPMLPFFAAVTLVVASSPAGDRRLSRTTGLPASLPTDRGRRHGAPLLEEPIATSGSGSGSTRPARRG